MAEDNASFLTASLPGPIISKIPGNVCPSPSVPLSNWQSCRAALSLINPTIDGCDFNLDEYDKYPPTSNETDWPQGCYECKNDPDCADGVWFNTHPVGAANGDASIICSAGEPGSFGGTLFVGDSDVDFFVNQETRLLTTTQPVYNVGYCGFTCKDVLKEADAMIAAFRPDIIVLVCGENDLDAGRSVAKTFELYTKVVAKYTAAGSQVYSFSTKPEPDSTELYKKYKKLDARIKKFAASAEGQQLTFIDSYTGFVDLGNPTSLYSDGLHLSEEGYVLWEQWLKIALDNNGNGCEVYSSGTCVQFPSTPSSVPTESPTESPTSDSTTTSECTNDPDFRKNKKDCAAFLRKNTHTKCLRKKNTVVVADSCPTICKKQLCQCEDQKKPIRVTYRDPTTKKKKKRWVTCKQIKKKRWCKKKSTSKTYKLHHFCPVSCGTTCLN